MNPTRPTFATVEPQPGAGPSPGPSTAPSSATPQAQLRVDQPEIANHIVAATGPEGLAIASLIEAKGTCTDLEILAAFGHLKPSQVRRLLYRLQDSHVAQYVKDTDGSGWDTFLWHLCLDDVRDALARRAAQDLAQARHTLALEGDGFDFACGRSHGRIPFAEAVDLRFLCPVCRAPMQSCASPEAPWQAAVPPQGLAALAEACAA